MIKRDRDDVGAAGLAALERSVVETVLYSDLFDYPLTLSELHRYLIGQRASGSQVADAVASLTGRFLERHGDYVFLAGRSEIVGRRQRRYRVCRQRWIEARSYARALSRQPFVRMVAICGSLALDNADQDGDIDVFCIAAPGRLWWAQVAAMLLRRRHRWGRHKVCPNIFLSLDSLVLQQRSLYVAREIVQAVPLTGEPVYWRFFEANDWLHEYLPNSPAAPPAPAGEPRRSGAVAAVERMFSGWLGSAIDRAMHAVLLRYYAVRLRRWGVTLGRLRRYYRRDRQLIVGEGYGEVVRDEFARRLAELLGVAAAAESVDRLFPGPGHPARIPRDEQASLPLYAAQFESRYGPET